MMKSPIILLLFGILLVIPSSSAQGNAESTLIIEPPDPIVEVDSEVTLICSDDDDPFASFRWLRGGNLPLPSNAEDEFGYLTISNFQSENAGVYICEKIVDSESDPVQSAEVTILLNQSSLDSSVSTIPHASDKVEVTASPSTSAQRADVTLLVEKPRTDSSVSTTTIHTTNKVGVTVSPSTPARRADVTPLAEKLRTDSSVSTTTIHTSNKVGVTVSPSAPAQRADVTLLAEKLRIDSSSGSTTTIRASNKVGVTVSPSAPAQRADVTLLAEKLRIDPSSVSTTPHASGKVELIIDPPHSLVKLHSKVTFSCHAKDNSPVSVHWQRRNKKVPLPSRAVDENGKLTISDVQPEDAGLYICETTGGPQSTLVRRAQVALLVERSSDDSAHRVLQEVDEGELTIYPVYPSVNLHSTITLSCYAKDHSPVSVQWRRRERNIPFPSHAVVKNGNLTIHDAQLEDGGFYVCETTGDSPSKLNERADVTLFVDTHGIAPSSVSAEPHPSENVELRIDATDPSVKLHSTIILSCYANDHSPVFVQWRRQGKIPLPSSALVMNGKLAIIDAKAEDAGLYACQTTDDSPLKLPNMATITLHVERQQ